MLKILLAEFIGTFTLCLTVVLSVTHAGGLPTPVLAGLVLGLFVYTIGPISGCHINPGVTIGLWSVKKISDDKAVQYLAAQLLAGICVLVLVMALGMTAPQTSSSPTFGLLFELIGMVVFTFGIGAVVFGAVSDKLAGLVVGPSLLVGISISSLGTGAGILNPAVGISLGVTVLGYYAVEIIGGIVGFQLYSYFANARKNSS